jgi:hypothetical protein
MQRTRTYLAVGAIICIALFLCNSCHKIEQLRIDLQNGNADLKQCVIAEIEVTPDEPNPPFPNFQKFTYNKRKDPVTATRGFIGTGSPQWRFYYDDRSRLITFAGRYNGTGFEFWHNYFYDRSDRIVGDSLYILGDSGQFDKAAFKYYSVLSYDRLNRVIREVKTGTDPNAQFPLINNYNYGPDGNYSGLQNNDHAVNFLLTNKIWRFLARDYSLNNLVAAAAYNEHGLPTRFASIFSNNDLDVFSPISQAVTIHYDCSDDTHVDDK